MTVLTSTRTVTVNPAFLQEIKEVNQELWHSIARLRQRCSRPINPRICRHLVELLGELRDQLALHFSLEEAYGYFEEPLYAAPRLSREADHLRNEHGELYSELCAIVERAEQMLFDAQQSVLALWVRQAYLKFDARLRRHEERENELILAAYDDDIGCGD